MAKTAAIKEESKSNLMTNKEAIEELQSKVEQLKEACKEKEVMLLKTQGALEVLMQLDKGVVKPNDSKSTD